MGRLWKHCDTCNEPLGIPTLTDKIVGSKQCDKCGQEHALEKYEQRDAVRDVLKHIGLEPRE